MSETTITLTISGSAAVIAQALAAISGTSNVTLAVPDAPLDNVVAQPITEPATHYIDGPNGLAPLPSTAAIPPVPAVAATIPPMPELDADGVAWNAELHAASKTKTADGKWRKRRGAGATEPTAAPATIPPMPPGDNAIPAVASAMPLPTPGVQPAPLPVNVTNLVQSQPDGMIQGTAPVVAGAPPALPVTGATAAITPAQFLQQLLLPAINAAKAQGVQLVVGEVMSEVGNLIGVGDLTSPAQLKDFDASIVQIAYDTTKQLLVGRGLLA